MRAHYSHPVRLSLKGSGDAGVNVHFVDHMEDGELMRAIGLDV